MMNSKTGKEIKKFTIMIMTTNYVRVKKFINNKIVLTSYEEGIVELINNFKPKSEVLQTLMKKASEEPSDFWDTYPKYRHIENCLDMLIKGFKDKPFSKKEMVHMRYDCFLELIEFIF